MLFIYNNERLKGSYMLNKEMYEINYGIYTYWKSRPSQMIF